MPLKCSEALPLMAIDPSQDALVDLRSNYLAQLFQSRSTSGEVRSFAAEHTMKA